MPNNNTCIISGHLGKDPEIRATTNSHVCNFSIATSRGKDEKKKTTWINVVIWGDNAKRIHRLVRKGDGVTIIGQWENRTWKDRDGVERYSNELVAWDISLHMKYVENKINKLTQGEPDSSSRETVLDQDDLPF